MKNNEHPIIFTAPMVAAILEGRKTQTRRIIKPQPRISLIEKKGWIVNNRAFYKDYTQGLRDNQIYCPYGSVGHNIWIRENFSVKNFYEGRDSGYIDDFECASVDIIYADGTVQKRELIEDSELGFDNLNQARRAQNKKSVPSIHMPRWASRIDLLIKDIRVERLQDISESDACAEGYPMGNHDGKSCYEGMCRDWYQGLWDKINGSNSWDENPWVWAITFEMI